MLLVEEIDYINNKLFKEYGSELLAGSLPRFRVVFSDDQFEKRWMTHTKDGWELLHPEVREVPKYRQYIDAKYVLERLVPRLPDSDVVDKVVYEPIWTFVDMGGNYLPPTFDMCSVIIDSLFQQMNHTGFAKYKDPSISPEERRKKLDEMYSTLFSNETPAGDALAHGYGVVNPAGKEHFNSEEVSAIEKMKGKVIQDGI